MNATICEIRPSIPTPEDREWWQAASNENVRDYCLSGESGPAPGELDRPTIDPESTALARQLRRHAATLEPDGRGTRDLMVRAAERMHEMVRYLEEAEIRLSR